MQNEQPQKAARIIGNNPDLGDFLRHDVAHSPRWRRPDEVPVIVRNQRSMTRD